MKHKHNAVRTAEAMMRKSKNTNSKLDEILDASGFLAGQQCCIDNKECPANAGPDFQRGYGVEYEKAEIETHKSMSMANSEK